jgi:hydrogenase maturation protein HypF
MAWLEMQRRAISVTGTVQGVGFRPYVHGLASRLDLSGWVQNRSGRVLIEVEGGAACLDHFLAALTADAPPLSHIESLSCEPVEPRGDRGFRIAPSSFEGSSSSAVSPDVATCDACQEELRDPQDRRFRYPFINCTHCGPRLTIIVGMPYDRERTTMLPFRMCAACRTEYENPADRRFHAQPVACSDCGPRLVLLDAEGRPMAGDPLADIANALNSGAIAAVKGLGGYHLVCDATRKDTVAKLRRRKHRDEKPFAVMVANGNAARAIAHLGPQEEALLTSPRRPIVLLHRKKGAVLSDAVAPGNPYVGVMLPYTPLHHLLMEEVGTIPLVMTSGNRSDEPLVYKDEEALHRLHGIADCFLLHDRPIHLRCDDSVTRVVAGAELPIRRSRGWAPAPLSLPIPARAPLLALGGQLKATFALGNDRTATLSHHIGDLDDHRAFAAYEREIEHYQKLFVFEPEVLVHDLHPDYASTRYAVERQQAQNLICVAVQHHHAHMASCMAENGLRDPVIGVTYDGAGYGTDGTIWGGEILVGDFRSFERAFHLRPVPLPGGDAAIREPFRMAMAHLLDAGEDVEALLHRIPALSRQIVTKMIERQVNAPLTSSMGRLFDAVASLCGIRDRASYEGQAAMELEWQATGALSGNDRYPFSFDGKMIDTRPLVSAVVRDVRQAVSIGVIARRFHSTVTAMTVTACDQIQKNNGLRDVVLSGGCFQNALMLAETMAALRRQGFRVHRHRRVPPNDGGLCLGQLAVAAARLESGGGSPTCA